MCIAIDELSHNLTEFEDPGPTIHSQSMHGFPIIHGYQHGYL